MKFFSSTNQKGFSLVELMVVVAIISILAALALPRFQIFQAKARQSEAKANLQMIYTLQQAYHGENDVYVAVAATGAVSGNPDGNCPNNDIGFVPEPCAKARYSYKVTLGSGSSGAGSGGTQSFIATATAVKSVNPSCTLKDTWTIDQNKVLTNTQNAISCTSSK